MKNRFSRISRPCLVVIFIFPTALRAQVTLKQDRDVYVFENSHFQIQVDASAGGRICSWILKRSGREVVALWKGGQEIGGVLDDRAFFTADHYKASIMRPGPQTASLRMTSMHPSGLSVVKSLTVEGDSPVLAVAYEFSNGTQAPATLWIRNFLLPGTKPQTDAHLYWVNGEGERNGKPAVGIPGAANYYTARKPEYAALWDQATGDGVYLYAPGADRFYFWRGSTVSPTFEWIYPEVRPGRILFAQVVLGTLSGTTAEPDWSKIIKQHERDLPNTRVLALEGWVDEATKFQVTDGERERGFWLSMGREAGKQRLPELIPLDLPLDDDRYLAITINILKDITVPVRLETPEVWLKQVQAFWETPGRDRLELLPLPQKPVTFKTGSEEQLWLRVRTTGKPAGKHRIPLVLHLGDRAIPLNLQLCVWPVKVESRRPFHVRGYCGGFPVWAGGYEVTQEKLRRLEAILQAYAEIGGDVLDFNAIWVQIIGHVKLEATGENLAEVAKKSPERIDLNNLPALDFSYYDPWFRLAMKHGVSRVETYLPHLAHEELSGRLLVPAVGKARIEPGSVEARRVVVWFYAQMKGYLKSRGLQGFFAKISDEISMEYIPTYLETAEVAREAGWRPFTTITGMIARTASYIRQMDPQCDQWQLSFLLKDDFLSLLNTRFRLTEKRIKLEGAWAPYGNGGAEATWQMHVFGQAGAAGIDPGDVEGFELLEEGRPLCVKGGSPWGNRERGVVFTAGTLQSRLFVSPMDGRDPKTHSYELVVKVRQETPDGQPLVSIDGTDEIWCYGGSSRPFRRSYESAWVFPLMTLFHDFCGYGLWAFYHWNPTERIIWIDDNTNEVTVSPVYCGYRDGWRDALLLAQLIRARNRQALEPILGERDQAVLHVAKETREVYQFLTISNANNPAVRNQARAAALRALAENP